MQLVPPAFEFVVNTLFGFLEHLQSLLSMTALPVPVKGCLTWASGVGHVLLTKINCSDNCCCPDIHHTGTQAICSFGINADLSQ